MQFVAGNRAVRDHAVNGEDLHLFRSVPGGLEYLGQFIAAGYELVPDVPDQHRNPPAAIASS